MLPFGVMIAATKLPLERALDGKVELSRAKWTNPRPHRHAELELNLLLRGRGEYVVNDRKYVLRPGTIAWLFEGHSHLLLNQTDDYEMWVVVFRPRLVRRVCTAPAARILRRANPAGNFCKVIPVAPFQRLDRLCRDIVAAESDLPRMNAGLGFLLLEAWDTYLRSNTAVEGTTLHPAVERAAQLLKDEREEQDGWDFSRLARTAGLSASRLGRLFKEQTGVTIVDYRNQLRVQRFIDLYGAGQRITMLRAALEAGFGSYTQFHRVFAKTTGAPPRTYYRQQRENRFASAPTLTTASRRSDESRRPRS